MAESIFRKQSLEKVNSPEQLNDYIKTSRPGAWLIVVAAIVLLTSVIVWGTFASLDTVVAVRGIASGDTLTCYSADVSGIKEGCKVNVGDVTGEVVSVSEKPLSAAQVTEQISADEYTLYCLALSDWNYVIEISLDGETAEGFTNAEIVSESVTPISFILD